MDPWSVGCKKNMYLDEKSLSLGKVHKPIGGPRLSKFPAPPSVQVLVASGFSVSIYCLLMGLKDIYHSAHALTTMSPAPLWFSEDFLVETKEESKVLNLTKQYADRESAGHQTDLSVSSLQCGLLRLEESSFTPVSCRSL